MALQCPPLPRLKIIDVIYPPERGYGALSEKWEAMDIVPTLEPDRPADQFLIVGNDNDFMARRCRMSGQSCDSRIDNDNRILVYRVRLPTLVK